MKRKTSIIVLTYNNLDYTKDCLDSIYKYTDKDTYEIIIIDNCSTDGTRDFLKTKKDLKVIYNDRNVGFPKGCNQGIEIADSNNDILLLNNDTVVTHNWLKNLKTCLYSREDIGAVGAVCNNDENRQGVDFLYDDLDTMQKKAKENNISNPNMWEEKVFLIGFCLLIKREVIEKLEMLDEEYSPGYIEDNDLSLRIIKLGYKLMLCHDCFIHHYLGTCFRKDLNKFYPILYKNRDYFYNKWKFNTFSFDDIKSASFPLIKEPNNILELNCGIGVTMLSLKYQYKNILIEGVESDESKRNISKKFSTVYKSLDEAKDNFYDYILIGNILDDEKDINKLLNKLKKYLNKDGCIVLEFSNFASIKNINKILNGECYKINKFNNLFSLYDMKNILERNGFSNFEVFHWYEKLTNEEDKLMSVIGSLYPFINYTYYTLKAKKNN